MLSSESYSPTTEGPKRRIDGLADAALAVGRGLVAGLTPPPPVDFTLWAQNNIVFEADQPMPGPYDPELYPFNAEILKTLQPDDPCREVVLKGSAQWGKTIIAMVFTGASIELLATSMLYVHPSIDNGRRWVNTKWKPFVRMSPSLRTIMPPEKTKDTANSTLYKERRDGRAKLLVSGANSPASLSLVTFKHQVQDDLAKWENNDAGDPESQADSRSQAYEDAKILKVSTPLIEGLCRISKAYKRSDQRQFHVPCPQCDHYQALEWENFRKSIHDGMDPEDAHFTCAECGCPIEHHHKRDIVARGRWVAHNPESRTPGFFIWTAYSPLRSWSYIVDEWFKAKGSPEAEQNFYNDKLGLAYETKGEAPPWKDIAARAKESDYTTGTIPNGAPMLVLSADVQGDRVEWLLKAFGPNLRRFTVQRGLIQGHISEAQTRSALDALLRRTWKNRFGQSFAADIMAIDGNYDTNDVEDWAKRWPESRVIIVRGANSHHAPPLVQYKAERKNDGKQKRQQKRYYHVGVSGLKASLYKHLEKKDPLSRGYCGFPNDLEDDYFRQLCSEKRVLRKKSNGAVDFVWERLPDVRNEVLDMENYAEAGARRLGWHDASDAEWEQLTGKREIPPPDGQMDLLEPNVIEKTTQTPSGSGRRVRSRGING